MKSFFGRVRSWLKGKLGSILGDIVFGILIVVGGLLILGFLVWLGGYFDQGCIEACRAQFPDEGASFQSCIDRNCTANPGQ